MAHPVPGLVVVAGGKYTTYRVMAKDAVDEAVHGLDQRVAECVTEDIPCSGPRGTGRCGTRGRASRSAPDSMWSAWSIC